LTNRAFNRALHALAHPLSVGAVLLLLLNDHLLRHVSPSWLTGKLGDWTWLTFAPLIAAAALAWLVPKKHPHQERIVGGLAFVSIGAWFTLAKTTPLVHGLTGQVFEALFGWGYTIRMDATDLLTLPALLVGWWVWRGASAEAVRLPSRAVSLILFALGIAGTVANSCGVANYGITQFCQKQGRLFAYATSNTYESADGGLTWMRVTDTSYLACRASGDTRSIPQREPWLLRNGRDTYRFVPTEGIYRYTDGQDEQLEIDLLHLNNTARKWSVEGKILSVWCSGIFYAVGPHDAILHQPSGNLVVAMGHDGVLVRSRDGVWQWAAVDDYTYTHAPFNPISYLRAELLAAGLLIFLAVPTIANVGRLSFASTGVLSFAWIAWLAFTRLSYFPLDISAVAALVCLLLSIALWRLVIVLYPNNTRRAVLTLFGLALGTAAFYLLPYALWAHSMIALDGNVLVLAPLSAFAGVYASQHFMGAHFPLRKRKPKNEHVDAMVTIDPL
jgi:hypothetical protein